MIKQNGNAARHPTVDTPWMPVPFTSQKQIDAGLAGGEGSQWPTFISFDHIDGSLAFLGIDVGGMYRSKDGGKNWEHCTIGILSSASSCAEVDPTNNSRVLCVGCDSSPVMNHGVYLSVDGGDTWKHVCPQNTQGHRDFRHQLAFDKSSYDKDKGYCTVAYYVRESKPIRDHYLTPAMYKTVDGGETWTEICTDKAIGDGILYVNPGNGWIYIANTDGAIRSKDGGNTFEKMLDKVCYGMCVVDTMPNNIYISAEDGFYVSADCGDTFRRTDESGYPTVYPARVNVSPANPDNMMLQDDHLSKGIGYTSVIYYSNDGGKTWMPSKIDASMSLVPYNCRQTVFAWHPTDPDVCISTGGDMVMRSTDAGKTFVWSGSGYNGSCTTGIYINANNNDLIFCSNQDYDGALTVDGGKTWKYTGFSGNSWGGFTYGGYPVTKDIIIAVPRIDRTHYIARTTDGAETFTITDIAVKGARRGHGVIGKENIVFIGEHRSDDYGMTWSEMDGCTGVYSCTNDGVLYGINGKTELVGSDDYGITWQKLDTFDYISDVKYDEFNKQLLILSGNIIRKYDADKHCSVVYADIGKECRGFDIDPRNGYIYTSVSSTLRCEQAGVLRSEDGGKTWISLTRAPEDGSIGPDGGKKAEYIVINRKYNQMWTNCGCRGVWKIDCKE